MTGILRSFTTCCSTDCHRPYCLTLDSYSLSHLLHWLAIGPVTPRFYIDPQRDIEFHHRGHLLGNEFCEGIDVAGGDFKNELVVYLQEHSGRRFFLTQPAMNVDHRQFDQVGRRALDDRIDGGAFRQVPLTTGTSAYAANCSPSPEDSTNIPFSAALFQYFCQEFFDSRIAVEISLDKLCRGRLFDSQLFGQPERALPINYAKIDRFCGTPHFSGNPIERYTKHLSSHPGVHILVPRKRLGQRPVA